MSLTRVRPHSCTIRSAAAALVMSIEKLVGRLVELLLLLRLVLVELVVTVLLLMLHDLLLHLQLGTKRRLLSITGLERPRC